MRGGIALTEADKEILRKSIKDQRLGLLIFGGIVATAAIVVAIGFLVTPEAEWPAIASIFVVFFAIGLLLFWREANAVTNDLQGGMKEKVSGVISKKQIYQGRSTVDYDGDTLQRIAMRVEEESSGKPITRYGAADMEIDKATRLYYGITINKKDYHIGIHNYLLVNEGDTVELETGPRSKTVLSLKKSG